jgi:predicted NUDIX family phosphoesterase
LREVEEEVNIEKKFISEMTALWYINDETSEVSQVHIWICYILKTSSINYELLDWEINNWEFVSFERLIEMHESSEYDLENWSAIVIDFLKDYLVK